jgi:hypothetical protein
VGVLQIIKQNSQKTQQNRKGEQAQRSFRGKNRFRAGQRRTGRDQADNVAAESLKVVIDNAIGKSKRRGGGRRVRLCQLGPSLVLILFLLMFPIVNLPFTLHDPGFLSWWLTQHVSGGQFSRGTVAAQQLADAPRDIEALEGPGKWQHDLYDGEPRQRRTLRERLAGDPTGATL